MNGRELAKRTSGARRVAGGSSVWVENMALVGSPSARSIGGEPRLQLVMRTARWAAGAGHSVRSRRSGRCALSTKDRSSRRLSRRNRQGCSAFFLLDSRSSLIPMSALGSFLALSVLADAGFGAGWLAGFVSESAGVVPSPHPAKARPSPAAKDHAIRLQAERRPLIMSSRVSALGSFRFGIHRRSRGDFLPQSDYLAATDRVYPRRAPEVS